MKKTVVLIGLLLLSSSIARAGKAPSTPLPLSSFLSSLSTRGSCPTPSEAAARKGLPEITAEDVTCTADCGGYAPVSCTTSGSCSAVDRNCSAGQQGYVECNGVYTYCPACGCVEGSYLYEDGGCCIGGRQRTLKYQCINGIWEHVSTSCSGSCW